MRLVCPNCGARYEVPEENIPSTGRDVQCSACDKTWFQTHSDPAPWRELSIYESDKGRVQPSEVVLENASAEYIVKEAVSAKPTDNESTSNSATAGSNAPKDLKEVRTKRRLHPTVAEVLREEARREAEVRAAETIESETDRGFGETTQYPALQPNEEENGGSAGASKRSVTSQSDMKTEEELDKPLNENKSLKKQNLIIENQGDASQSKSELLHNIDDSTRTIASDVAVAVGETEENTPIADFSNKKMGRLGFVTGLLIIAILFAIYQYENRITAGYAPLAPAMIGYVSFVDRMRAYSDQSLHDAIAWLNFRAERARKDATQD